MAKSVHPSSTEAAVAHQSSPSIPQHPNPLAPASDPPTDRQTLQAFLTDSPSPNHRVLLTDPWYLSVQPNLCNVGRYGFR